MPSAGSYREFGGPQQQGQIQVAAGESVQSSQIFARPGSAPPFAELPAPASASAPVSFGSKRPQLKLVMPLRDSVLRDEWPDRGESPCTVPTPLSTSSSSSPFPFVQSAGGRATRSFSVDSVDSSNCAYGAGALAPRPSSTRSVPSPAEGLARSMAEGMHIYASSNSGETRLTWEQDEGCSSDKTESVDASLSYSMELLPALHSGMISTRSSSRAKAQIHISDVVHEGDEEEHDDDEVGMAVNADAEDATLTGLPGSPRTTARDSSGPAIFVTGPVDDDCPHQSSEGSGISSSSAYANQYQQLHVPAPRGGRAKEPAQAVDTSTGQSFFRLQNLDLTSELFVPTGVLLSACNGIPLLCVLNHSCGGGPVHRHEHSSRLVARRHRGALADYRGRRAVRRRAPQSPRWGQFAPPSHSRGPDSLLLGSMGAPAFPSGSLMGPGSAENTPSQLSGLPTDRGSGCMPPRWERNCGGVGEGEGGKAVSLFSPPQVPSRESRGGRRVSADPFGELGAELHIDRNALHKLDIPNRNKVRSSRRRNQLTKSKTEPMMHHFHPEHAHHSSPGVMNKAATVGNVGEHHSTPVTMRALDCYRPYSWELSEATDLLCIKNLEAAAESLLNLHGRTLTPQRFAPAVAAARTGDALQSSASTGSLSQLAPSFALGGEGAQMLDSPEGLAHGPGSGGSAGGCGGSGGFRIRRAFSEAVHLNRQCPSFGYPPALSVSNWKDSAATYAAPELTRQSEKALLVSQAASTPFSPTLEAISSLDNSQHFRMQHAMINQRGGMTPAQAEAPDGIACATPASVEEERRKRKMLKSRAKQRRMSSLCQPQQLLAPLGAVSGTFKPAIHLAKKGRRPSAVFSPEAKSKFGVGAAARHRRTSLYKQLVNSRIQETESFISNASKLGDESRPEMSLDRSSIALEQTVSDAHAELSFGSSAAPLLLLLNELNFKGVVIGGVYQHCFDGACPLVAAPASSDKRVVDVEIQNADNALVLSLYLPKDKAAKKINLGSDWQWLRCSPTGYLASRGSVKPHTAAVCYYLPKHPDDWTQTRNRPSIQPQQHDEQMLYKRPLADAIMPMALAAESLDCADSSRDLHVACIEMDCLPLQERTFSAEFPTAIACSADEDGFEFGQFQSTDEWQLSPKHPPREGELPSFNALQIEDKAELCEELPTAAAEHWSNSALMALVLDFLVQDSNSSTVGAAAAAPASQNQRLTRRRAASATGSAAQTQAADPAAAGYRCVCRSWALAVDMVIAKRRSVSAVDCGWTDGPNSRTADGPGQAMFLNFKRFSRFLSSHYEGRFLSEGACKDVYRVRNADVEGRRQEAVSVMDLEDLEERDMAVAVAQELEISMICSSLISLNICPNLVQVFSIFQSECGAPRGTLWKDKGPKRSPQITAAAAEPPTLPRKSELPSGRFQFMRMEFCSGGDVETVVRSAKQLSEQTVRSFLFQMCFALYTCREKLALRHFDVKLLNFFASSGAGLIDSATCKGDNTSAAADSSSFNVKIGFGHYVYHIPVHAENITVVKLADFGTSCMGSTALGDPITVQQVLLMICRSAMVLW